VKLVEYDNVDLREEWIGLQLPEEDPLGAGDDARVFADAAFVSDLVADLFTDSGASLLGNVCGGGAGGYAARLQEDDLLVREASV